MSGILGENPVRIKICGLTRLEDIEAVNRFMPDYIGFVFAESRRRAEPEQAKALKAMLDPDIQAVGVFVNEPVENIVELCKCGIIDVVQLHGDETRDTIEQLKKLIDCPVVKAVRVRSAEQILEAEKLPCDMLLLDTYVKGQYGGSGASFDRRLIPELKKPFFLAGGLDENNVLQAIEDCHPCCVDISSGAELDGRKDAQKIKRLVELVHTGRSDSERKG
ncbi:phosphoribosylanthranilate isomerase [Anaerolentibacter hominis]|uniref:phosphoribosylanthranilate isomerase n=1 Tax=Anaerolentibacter hominis TaxID=3079009 RepID=UPI0031B7FE74